MAADDDRPGAPALEDDLRATEFFLGQADVPPKAVDEGTAIAPADRQVAGASKHRSRDDRRIGQRVWDRTGRREVSAVCDRDVTRRRQRHTELLEEDDEEKAARLVMQHE